MVLGNFDVYGDLTLQANLTSSSRTALSQDTGTTLIVGGFTILSTGSASTIRLTAADTQLQGSTTGEETV